MGFRKLWFKNLHEKIDTACERSAPVYLSGRNWRAWLDKEKRLEDVDESIKKTNVFPGTVTVIIRVSWAVHANIFCSFKSERSVHFQLIDSLCIDSSYTQASCHQWQEISTVRRVDPQLKRSGHLCDETNTVQPTRNLIRCAPRRRLAVLRTRNTSPSPAQN